MEDDYTNRLVFFLNGKKIVEVDPDPDSTLLLYLRDNGLTGAKVGCGQGACGTCTVMISHFNNLEKTIIHRAVTSCLVPLCSLHGKAVTTVEGIGSVRSGLHPIQERLVDNHGIQCGFCTPGMVMSMYALLRTTSTPSRMDIENALDGNLCRCTGYRPIVETFQTFCQEFVCELGDDCCKNAKPGKEEEKKMVEKRMPTEYEPYDPSQEPIFPSELQVSDKFAQTNLRFEGPAAVLYRPSCLSQLLQILENNPSAKIVSGFTRRDVRSTSNVKRILIRLDSSSLTDFCVKESVKTSVTKPTQNGTSSHQSIGGVKLGATLTINEAVDYLRLCIGDIEGHQARGLEAVIGLLQRFGSNQIRNQATLGGSLMTNCSNSDVIVALLAADARLSVIRFNLPEKQEEEIPLRSWISHGLYSPGSDHIIIRSVTIPFCSENQHVCTFKQSARRALDRAIVNAGLCVTLVQGKNTIKNAELFYGGLSSSIVSAKETSESLINREVTLATHATTLRKLNFELNKYNNDDYRIALAIGFYYKFVGPIIQDCKGESKDMMDMACCERIPSTGAQVWEEVPPGQDPHDAVGRPKPHISAKQLSTGEASFYIDIPVSKDELFLALVRSTKAHAEILTVDTTDALSMEGVIGYIDHTDVPSENVPVGTNKDEIIFTDSKVECYGQLIGGIVAETEQQARRAAQAVKITYKELTPIITIEDAIRANSFFNMFEEPQYVLSRGDTEAGFQASDHVKEGTVRVAAQDHFYLETNFAYVKPLKGDGEYEVFMGCQDIKTAHEGMAATLGIPQSKILIRQKRIGGAFGGKERHAPITLVLRPAAVAAHKFQRPIRCHLTKEEDLSTTGGRHPYRIDYKVGFMDNGKITAAEYKLFSNGGSVEDWSTVILAFSAAGAEGPFRIPNIKVTAKCCKTNTSSPTAMRGFGRPQMLLATNIVIDHIAHTLGMTPEEISDKNLMCAGDPNLAGRTVSNNLRTTWEQLHQICNVPAIRRQLADFNKRNQWKKRGVAVTPTVFPIGFPFQKFYQSVAHVNVYIDGSVLINHGGIEMGQGINTKMVQIASRELGIPAEKVHISESSTTTNPNSASTAASAGTDIHGKAVMNACRKLMEGLDPIVKDHPKSTWNDIVMKANDSNIPLTAVGFCDIKVPNEGKLVPMPPMYFTYGAACSMVEVDILTGEHVALQTEIVMEVGKSLNPGIDIGQIEGAFMQGYGLHVMEEIIYGPDGYMLSRDAETYKVPTVADIPRKFHVTLMKSEEEDWVRPIYSAKGIGEPALALGSSVYFAIKDAVRAARKQRGLSDFFPLDSPATTERIRMACSDMITDLIQM